MKRPILRLVVAFATTALLTLPHLGAPAHAAGAPTATFSKGSGFGTGYQGKYTITNGGSTTLTGRKIEADVPAGGSIGSAWDTVMTHSGTHYTFTNESYNGTLAPGASVSFGFSGAPESATSVNCTLNGQSCAGGGGGGTDTSATAKTQTGGGSGGGTYQKIGYYPQWGIYGRNFWMKNLDANGAAGKLTALNYSFENIDPNNVTCFETTKATSTNPSDPDQGTGAGDQYADYGASVSAANDGVGDTWDQKLKGNFNQIKKLKAKHPEPQGARLPRRLDVFEVLLRRGQDGRVAQEVRQLLRRHVHQGQPAGVV